MNDDFQTKMRRQNPAASINSAVNSAAVNPAVPAAGVSAAHLSAAQKAFFAGEGKVSGRKLTPEERAAVSQGSDPYAGLTEHERRTAIALGINSSVPLDSELANRIAELVPKADLEAVSRQARTADVPQAVPMSSLPEEEQRKIQQTLNSIVSEQQTRTEFAASYPDSVRQTLEDMQNGRLRRIDLPETEPVQKPSPKPVQKPNNEPPANEHVSSEYVSLPEQADENESDVYHTDERNRDARCIHCGKDPFGGKDEIEISKEDKKTYLIAVGTGNSFEKEYKLFGGVITLRLRSLRTGESEWLYGWAVQKAIEESKDLDIKPPWEAFTGIVSKYMAAGYTAVQTTYLSSSIEGSPLFWKVPSGRNPKMTDWEREYPEIKTLDKLLEVFTQTVASEAVCAAVRNKILEFNKLDYELTVQSENTENFWAGI